MSLALIVHRLTAAIDGKQILEGLDLEVPYGEVHAIMGPNGSGKSTLCHVLTGKPGYQVSGDARLDDRPLLGLEVDQRARLGLLQSFQYPTEIRGVHLREFLLEAADEWGIDPDTATERIEAEAERFGMTRFLDRSLNDDLSGGEKKRSEIFQMAVLSPRVALLDEIDSGLDVDAVRQVAEAVESMRSPDLGVVLITHYNRILKYLTADRIHVMIDGRIVDSGGAELADELEVGGYEAVRERLGLHRAPSPPERKPSQNGLMASGMAAAVRWLEQLTHLATAPGLEHAVVDWVWRWVGRRDDLRIGADDGGNLHITRKGRHRRTPVVAVAHMDHPAFVLTEAEGREVTYQFRGGVRSEYFTGAGVELTGVPGKTGRVVEHDASTGRGTILFRAAVGKPGDIARWKLPRLALDPGLFQAPACDDLAGVAAALTALDATRRRPDLGHFSVLLTRAEEMGFIGAIHAARNRTIPGDARILSIEASRSSEEAPLGAGPVIRVGDASSVFDAELTNLVARSAVHNGVPHQRRLMAGGSCEATAFGVYGYRATGLCLPLRNYHNMGDLDRVEQGRGRARAFPEVIALSDFSGLVDLLLDAVTAVDGDTDLADRLDTVYEEGRHLLG